MKLITKGPLRQTQQNEEELMKSRLYMKLLILLFPLLVSLASASLARAESIQRSSFFGGAGGDQSHDVTTDAQGSFIISGRAFADGFPALNAADNSFGGGEFDGVVVKFDSAGQPVFSTYLGGSGQDFGFAVATDQVGNIFVCGTTGSSDFPLSQNAFDNTMSDFEGFIVKYSPDGQVLHSTFFGGPNIDGISDVATDPQGNVYVVGSTGGGLPVTSNAYQSTYGAGGSDGFLAKLNNDCTDLIYCTYFGGSLADHIEHLSIDLQGNIHIAGNTFSAASSFPLLNAFDATLGGNQDMFIAKFSSSFMLRFSTYLGGTQSQSPEIEEQVGSVDVDESGRTYLVGQTWCTDFPMVNSLDNSLDGPPDGDGFIAILAADGGSLLLSTYWGGNSDYDNITDVEVSSDASFYICGSTGSTNCEMNCAFDSVYNPAVYPFEAFVTKFLPLGAGTMWSTYFGGSSADGMNGCGIFNDKLLLAGTSSSADFPLKAAYDSTLGDGTNFVNNIVMVTIVECADADCDWVCDADDNCPSVSNPTQADANSDGIGDACCCIALTGNVDGDLGDIVDISDLSAMVDYLFFSGAISGCPSENDVDGSASVDISDLSILVDFLFFGGSLPSCP